jgi:hypothetical protein
MKKNNYFILLSTALFFFSSFTIPPKFDEIIIFYDDFSDNRHNWALETDLSKGFIRNGTYELSSLGKKSDIRVQHLELIDESRDFEIEASLRIVGDSPYSNAIIWGSSSFEGQYEEGFSFGFNSQQQFIALETKASIAHDFFHWQNYPRIHKSEFNKILVKKERNKYHFYINDVLVKTATVRIFEGKNLGFHAANGATIQVDYLKISVFMQRA